MAEDTIEFVEVALILHQRSAREVIKILDPPTGEVFLHCLHQREIFAQRHRDAGGFEFVEKGDEHGERSLRARARRSSHGQKSEISLGLA